jgi:hypothetical protein
VSLKMFLPTPISHERQLFADEDLYQRYLAHLREQVGSAEEREQQAAALSAETLTVSAALSAYGARFRRARGTRCA